MSNKNLSLLFTGQGSQFAEMGIEFINDNGKIIPQRVTNMSRSIHTKLTKAIKQARFLSLI